MADTKVSALAALTGINVAGGDLFPMVDVSDTTMAASGTDKSITATELMLAMNAPTSVRITSTVSTTTTALANVTSLVVSVTSGNNYYFKFGVIYTSTVAATGIILGATTPTFSVYAANVACPAAADATSAMFFGWLTTSGDSVTSTGVQQTAGTGARYLATVEGFISPTANGTVQVQYASEVNNTTISVIPGSFGMLWTID